MRDLANANGSRLEGDGLQKDPSGGEGEAPPVAPHWIAWGIYEPAIRRWERITGRVACRPTEFGPLGNVRLAPAFPEWMMGVPEGWITDLGFSRKDTFRMIGNGVVPLQAALAIDGLMNE